MSPSTPPEGAEEDTVLVPYPLEDEFDTRDAVSAIAAYVAVVAAVTTVPV
jgi:hypothetical protein